MSKRQLFVMLLFCWGFGLFMLAFYTGLVPAWVVPVVIGLVLFAFAKPWAEAMVNLSADLWHIKIDGGVVGITVLYRLGAVMMMLAPLWVRLGFISAS